MSSDIIRDVLERAMAAAPSLTQECAAGIEREARAYWGGDEVYVAKAASRLPEVRAQVLHDALTHALPLAQIEQRYGISRRSIYRLLRSVRNG